MIFTQLHKKKYPYNKNYKGKRTCFSVFCTFYSTNSNTKMYTSIYNFTFCQEIHRSEQYCQPQFQISARHLN